MSSATLCELKDCCTDRDTMAGFEHLRPKTQGRNLALADSILFQFQKFKNLLHDPQFFWPWGQKCLEKE